MRCKIIELGGDYQIFVTGAKSRKQKAESSEDIIIESLQENIG